MYNEEIQYYRDTTIIRGTQTIGAVLSPEYAHAPFLPTFLIDFCSDGPVDVGLAYWPNLKSIALFVRGIIVGVQKCGQFLDTPTLSILRNF